MKNQNQNTDKSINANKGAQKNWDSKDASSTKSLNRDLDNDTDDMDMSAEEFNDTDENIPSSGRTPSKSSSSTDRTSGERQHRETREASEKVGTREGQGASSRDSARESTKNSDRKH